jgi:hypothetical protein
MHVQASLPMALFDGLLPAAEPVFTDQRPVRPRKSSTYEPLRAPGETLLSMAKLHERLALLAQLELPCTILIANPPLHLREAVIQTVELAGESLTVGGNGFSLRLRGPHIHSIRLVNQREAGSGTASLDILHSQGMLYASIQPAPEGPGGEVWRDVMDNPTLSLA